MGRIHRGAHQSTRSSDVITEGTRIVRTRVASSSTATAREMPICFICINCPVANPMTTNTMIRAAEVMILPELCSPVSMASLLEAPQPGVDLRRPKPQVAAEAEAARTAALVAQVVDGLGCDAEPGGQFRQGQDRLDAGGVWGIVSHEPEVRRNSPEPPRRSEFARRARSRVRGSGE